MFSTSEDPKIRPLCVAHLQPVGSLVLMKVIPSTFVQCLQDHLQPFNASSSPPPRPSPASLASTSWTPISLALDCISVLASATRPCTAGSVPLSEYYSASKRSIRRFVITEKATTRAFSWLKAATTAFTFKTLLTHNAKWALTPRSLNVKLGPRRNYHKGRAAIRHYANQTNHHL